MPPVRTNTNRLKIFLNRGINTPQDRPYEPVPNKPTVSVDVKQHFNNPTRSELRNCVKVEVAVLGSPSLISLHGQFTTELTKQKRKQNSPDNLCQLTTSHIHRMADSIEFEMTAIQGFFRGRVGVWVGGGACALAHVCVCVCVCVCV